MSELYTLGLNAYETGDYQTAKECFEKTIKSNGEFLFQLGANAYKINDYSNALKYFEKAAHLNNSNAMCQLGVMYESGQGVQQDFEKAMAYYQRSSELNNEYGIYNLARIYQKGAKDLEKCPDLYDKLQLKNNDISLDKLLTYLTRENAEKIIKICINTRNDKNNLIEQQARKIKSLEDELLAKRYAPGGEGYLEAKAHFEACL